MADLNLPTPQNPPNPTKLYTHFLYKAIFVSIFLLVIPLFPSQAPEFINQTINTRSWELLQLLVVGIAVSYGLFSKRNDETEKELGNSSGKFDSTQSYVAKLLQVSSVFDDESENLSENSKIQTWNAQYYRGEPIVVVAKENFVLDGGGDRAVGGPTVTSTASKAVEKARLLPVRSLRNGVCESLSLGNESKEKSFRRSLSSRSDFRAFSRNSREESEGKTEESVVFRSPIPWRSRSGRMELKEDSENPPPLHPPLFSQENLSELNPIESRSIRYQSSKANSNPSPQTKIHPSNPSLPTEIQSKIIEDGVREKPCFSSIPPPPPPPPPPHFLHKHPSENSIRNRFSVKPELKRITRSFPNEFSGDTRKRGDLTLRSKTEDEEYLRDDKEIERFIENRGNQGKKYEEFGAKLGVEDDKDSEESDEDDEFEEICSRNEGENDNGPDVDKKADEFIAKFREQIRLQRIASIRRSTNQMPNNGVR